MRLIVVNSNSSGNCYALDAGNEILLLEAGCKFKDVQKAIDFRADKVVGCITSHEHGDHFKYAGEYARHGIHVYGTDSVDKDKYFVWEQYTAFQPEKTYHIASFCVVPFANYHDTPIFGYLIKHRDMGVMLFSTDSYKIGLTVQGISHFLIESNYSDALLKENVWNGNINKAQADRIMLSHMSLDYCISYLRDCEAEKSAKTITLCHLSERNSDPDLFQKTVAGAMAVPCYVAHKGLIVEL